MEMGIGERTSVCLRIADGASPAPWEAWSFVLRGDLSLELDLRVFWPFSPVDPEERRCERNTNQSKSKTKTGQESRRERYTAVRRNTQSFWFGSLIGWMVDGPYRTLYVQKEKVL